MQGQNVQSSTKHSVAALQTCVENDWGLQKRLSLPSISAHRRHISDHFVRKSRTLQLTQYCTCIEDNRSRVAVRPQLLIASPAARAAATRTSHRSSPAPTAATARTSRSNPCSSPAPTSGARRCCNSKPSLRQSSDRARERAFGGVVPAPLPPPPPPLGDSARRARSKSNAIRRRATTALPARSASSSCRVFCGGASCVGGAGADAGAEEGRGLAATLTKSRRSDSGVGPAVFEGYQYKAPVSKRGAPEPTGTEVAEFGYISYVPNCSS